MKLSFSFIVSRICLTAESHVKRTPLTRTLCYISALHRVLPSVSVQEHRDMRAIKGVLLTCDSAVKQILLTMNEKDSFIIEDLDDFHLIIKADEVYRVKKQLETEVTV